MVEGKPTEYGHSFISDKDIVKLKELSSKAGGWMYYDEELIFLTWDEWFDLNKV